MAPDIRRHMFHAVLAIAIAIAGLLLYRTLRQYRLEEVLAAAMAIPAAHFGMALAFAVGSYTCLACSDWLAVRYAGKPLAFHRTALASFTSLSIGHNVGVAALSSGAVRFRFYSRWGLTVEDVAKVILFCGVTVGLGLATLGAIGISLRPDDAARATGFDASGIATLAAACLVVPLAYIGLSVFVRAPVKVFGWSFQLPGVRLALAQVLVGSANFAFVAASLHQMLSAFEDANYLKVAAASIIANIAAIVSHVPGGLGVLEATIAHILPGAESVAAVIAFRVAYYFIPLSLGLISLVASEIVFRQGDGEPQLEKQPQ